MVNDTHTRRRRRDNNNGLQQLPVLVEVHGRQEADRPAVPDTPTLQVAVDNTKPVDITVGDLQREQALLTYRYSREDGQGLVGSSVDEVFSLNVSSLTTPRAIIVPHRIIRSWYTGR